MLRVRLHLLLDRSSQPHFPARKAAPFVTEQTTRLVLPSHIEAVADAAAAAADFARNCGLADEAAFGIDMAVCADYAHPVSLRNKKNVTKNVEVTFNIISRLEQPVITDDMDGFTLLY